jgi:hypothetical protein
MVVMEKGYKKIKNKDLKATVRLFEDFRAAVLNVCKDEGICYEVEMGVPSPPKGNDIYIIYGFNQARA